MAPPTPRLNGSRKTVAPAARASSRVRSVEPSSMTMTSAPRVATASSTTAPTAPSSLRSGTITSSDGALTPLTVACGGRASRDRLGAAGARPAGSEQAADGPPVGPQPDVGHGHPPGQVEHAGVEDGRQQRRQRAVGDAAAALDLRPPGPQPRPVLPQPPPAPPLGPQPALAGGHAGDGHLVDHQDRRQEPQQPSPVTGEDEEEPVAFQQLELG